MKRIMLLVTVALMLAAAMPLSGVAQAASPRARCQAEAETLTGLDLTGYNFIAGKNKRADNFNRKATEGADVFCGFGGNDAIDTLDAGDIFIGGAGDDFVGLSFGTFYGGDGSDAIGINVGTFNGEAGNDHVAQNGGGAFSGTFNGGAGDDNVSTNSVTGTFNGGDGTDSVDNNQGGILSNVELGDV